MTLTEHPPAAAPPAAVPTLWPMLRLRLRRDRVQLPVWLLSLGLIVLRVRHTPLAELEEHTHVEDLGSAPPER